MQNQHFDSLAVGLIDFQNKSYDCFELHAGIESTTPYLYFDLASLTKPLTNSVARLARPELFDGQMDLLLNHKAGLPSGGLLSRDTWKEELWAYTPSTTPCETLYSDYSSLRCMLELEKKSHATLKELSSPFFDRECVHWKDLPEDAISPETGFRQKKVICGEVHDNNAYNIGSFLSHAGLFSTIGGLCRTLLNIDEKLQLNATLKEAYKTQNPNDRFILGFDRVMDPGKTLAGVGASSLTFGHLGFTGTSFWIDLNPSSASCPKGAVILTNATQTYWYDREGLNHLRRTLGELIWK